MEEPVSFHHSYELIKTRLLLAADERQSSRVLVANSRQQKTTRAVQAETKESHLLRLRTSR